MTEIAKKTYNILYKISNEHSKLNYFLTFLLVAYSGFLFFLGDAYLLSGFLFVSTIFFLQKIKIDGFLFFFIFLSIILFVLQTVQTDIFPFETHIGFIIRILFSYFTIKIIGKDFPKFYINVSNSISRS